SGIAAIGDLRRAFAHAIPALIVSGDTTDAAREETRAAGITMLAKPVVAGALRAAAEAIVAAAAPRMCHAEDPSLEARIRVRGVRARATSSCARKAFLELLTERFHVRQVTLEYVSNDGLLLRAEGAIQLQPRVTHLMPQRECLLLHGVRDGVER